MQNAIFKKSLIAFSVVTLVATVGVFGTQVLARDNNHNNKDDDHKNGYYTKDQCKHGGWKNFKNPDGSQKFKNQGQCVAFFNHENKDDNDDNNNHHQSSGSDENDD